MPFARRRPLLVLLSGMLATCMVIDEESGEEIGSYISTDTRIGSNRRLDACGSAVFREL